MIRILTKILDGTCSYATASTSKIQIPQRSHRCCGPRVLLQEI